MATKVTTITKDNDMKLIIAEDEGYKVFLKTNRNENDIDIDSIIQKHKNIVSNNQDFVKEQLSKLKHK